MSKITVYLFKDIVFTFTCSKTSCSHLLVQRHRVHIYLFKEKLSSLSKTSFQATRTFCNLSENFRTLGLDEGLSNPRTLVRHSSHYVYKVTVIQHETYSLLVQRHCQVKRLTKNTLNIHDDWVEEKFVTPRVHIGMF